MELDTLVSSLVLAVGLLVPLAVKWQIKVRLALVWAIVIGIGTGILWSWDWLRGGTDSTFVILFLEFFTIFLLTLLAVALLFYRDPERVTPLRPGIIVSPADGKVLYVKKAEKGEVPLAEKRGRKFKLEELAKTELEGTNYLIGIGMNLLNVHVNRAPIEGKALLLRHIKGDFRSLKAKDAILLNERFTTVISNGNLRIVVVQIASRLVRRIVSYLKEGQEVLTGQRIGMIKFGSQVDVLIPELEGLRVTVEPGDEVVAGVSVIAEYP